MGELLVGCPVRVHHPPLKRLKRRWRRRRRRRRRRLQFN